MKRPRLILYALLLLTWMACETVVEIDPPAYDPELVVTSYFEPDSLWSAAIHRSLGAGESLDPAAQYVENATVTILSNSDIVDTLRYAGRGHYVSNSERYPVAGKPYTLRAQVPGMTTVEAVSAAPVPTPITEISLENLGEVSSGAPVSPEYKFRIRFRLEDPPGRNFYRFGIYEFRGNFFRRHSYPDLNLPDSVYQSIPLDAGDVSWSCNYSDAYRGTPSTGCPSCTCINAALTDQLFDGQSYQVSVTFSLDPSSGGTRNEVLLLLSTLSEDYFEVKRTLAEQAEQNAAFSAPLDIYSNVKGGLGVFAGYSNTGVFLPIPLDE